MLVVEVAFGIRKTKLEDNMMARGLQTKAEKQAYRNNNIPGGSLGPGMLLWIERSHGIQL